MISVRKWLWIHMSNNTALHFSGLLWSLIPPLNYHKWETYPLTRDNKFGLMWVKQQVHCVNFIMYLERLFSKQYIKTNIFKFIKLNYFLKMYLLCLFITWYFQEAWRFLKKPIPGAPGWRSRLSVRLQPGHDLAVREFEPRVRLCLGWWLGAWSLFPILRLPLSLPLPRSCSVSLCPKNKKKTLKKKLKKKKKKNLKK